MTNSPLLSPSLEAQEQDEVKKAEEEDDKPNDGATTAAAKEDGLAGEQDLRGTTTRFDDRHGSKKEGSRRPVDEDDGAGPQGVDDHASSWTPLSSSAAEPRPASSGAANSDLLLLRPPPPPSPPPADPQQHHHHHHHHHQEQTHRRTHHSLPPHEARLHRIRQSLEDRIALRHELVDRPLRIALWSFVKNSAVELVKYMWGRRTLAIITLALLVMWAGARLALSLAAVTSRTSLQVAASLARPLLAFSILVGPLLCLHQSHESLLWVAWDFVRLVILDAKDWLVRNVRVSHLRNLVCALVLLPTALEMMVLHHLCRRILSALPLLVPIANHGDELSTVESTAVSAFDRPAAVATYAAFIFAALALYGTAVHRTLSVLRSPGKQRIRSESLLYWRRDGYVVLAGLACLRTAVDAFLVHGISTRSVVLLLVLLWAVWTLTSEGATTKGSSGNPSGSVASARAKHTDDESNDDDEDDDAVSRLLQRALRQALHDALQHCTDKVTSDEMLQLAMLRWVVDYWSTNAKVNNASATTTATSATAKTATAAFVSSTPAPASTHAALPPASESDIDWFDLRPMLSITAQQMQVEAAALSAEQEDQLLQVQTRRDASPPTHVSASAAPPPPSSASFSSSNFDDLHQMLLHMNLHEEAKPAVDAWRRTVAAFPPHRFTALVVATARRCPALLLSAMFVLGVVPASATAFGSLGWVVSSLLLLPMALLEVLRTQRWSDSCQRYVGRLQARSTTGEIGSSAIQNNPPSESLEWLLLVDPMVMILMGDDPSPVSPTPALLQVWYNVQGSVKALERGLVAATCVQTTAVAVDFAHHLCSLVNVGVHVSQQGWWFGVALLVQEAFLHWRATEEARARGDPSSQGAPPLIHSAVTVARHSKTLNRNLSRLLLGADETTHPLLSALPIDVVVGFLALVIGRGWLWARESHEATSSERGPSRVVSTVVIEELDEEDDAGAATDLKTDGCANDPKRQHAPESTTLDDLDQMTDDLSDSSAKPLPKQPQELQESTVYHLKLLDQVETIPERYAAVASQSLSCTEMPFESQHCTEAPFVDRLARVMDLAAECAENELLMEDERNALCERLSATSEGREVDELWIDAIAVSLQGMLDHATALAGSPDVTGMDLDAEVVVSVDTPDVEAHGVVKYRSGTEAATIATNAAIDIVKRGTSQDIVLRLDQAGQGHLPSMARLQDVSTPLPSDIENLREVDSQEDTDTSNFRYANDVSSTPPPAPQVDAAIVNRAALEASQTSVAEGTGAQWHDDALDFIPLSIPPSAQLSTGSECDVGQPTTASATIFARNYSSGAPNRVAVVDDASDDDDKDEFVPLDCNVPMLASPKKEDVLDLKRGRENSEDDDNLWLKVGGGLAIVGAIVGGAAAITMMNDNHNGRSDRKRTDNQERNGKQQ